MDIAKALIEDGRKIWSINNIHPVQLVQLHPLWPDAILKCKLEDYKDLPQIDALLEGEKGDKSIVAAAKAGTTAAVCPNEFYEFKKGKKKVPTSTRELPGRFSRLQALW
jgi:hypothetical protein